MKTIQVVAALIVHDGRIFATQRGYGEWKGWWKFPGGKVEPGEAPEDALVREIREELATEIRIERYVTTITAIPAPKSRYFLPSASYRYTPSPWSNATGKRLYIPK